MNHTLCRVSGCINEGKYCRIHMDYSVPIEKEISSKSDKKKDLDKQYNKVRKAYLSGHPFCEAKIPDCCTKVATDIHHKKGKIGEADYLDPKFFLAVCRKCHYTIEKNPAWSRQMGFSVSRLSKIK